MSSAPEELPDRYWSSDVEEVCEALRHNASVMSEYNKKNMWYYKNQLKYYKIPVIIISGFNSVIAVGLQPYLDQGLISASNCLLALICGIIGSIELFLGISEGAEKEQKSATEFYLLSVDIYKTLTLERIHRHQSGREYLDEKYNQYTNLFANSQLLKKKVADKLTHVPSTKGGFYNEPSSRSSSALDIEEGEPSIGMSIPPETIKGPVRSLLLNSLINVDEKYNKSTITKQEAVKPITKQEAVKPITKPEAVKPNTKQPPSTLKE